MRVLEQQHNAALTEREDLSKTIQTLRASEERLNASLSEHKQRVVEAREEMSEQLKSTTEQLRRTRQDLADERSEHLLREDQVATLQKEVPMLSSPRA